MIREDPALHFTTPPAAPRPRTIAFTSGKGGVGKSNLVLNTGVLLAQRGRRVVLVDGDLGLASLTVLLGLSPRHDLRHVVAGEKRLAEIVLRGPHGLTIVPAGSGVAELTGLDGAARDAVLGEVGELAAEADFVLVDTGAGISDTVLGLVLASDEAIVVTRPEPTALADAYALMKVVVRQATSFPLHLLVNMARDADEARGVFRSLSEILQRFLGYQPGYAGWVVTDPVVGRAVVEQVPFALLAPRAAATRGVAELATSLCGHPAPRDGAPFWERLAHWRRGRA